MERLSYLEFECLVVVVFVNNWESKEVDFVLWCLKNMGDSDFVDEFFERVLGDFRFCKIVD